MFENTTNLTTINGMSDWEGTKLQNVTNMFKASGIKNLDINKLITPATTNTSSMFANSKIEILDASNWNISNVTNMSSMFSTTTNLTTINGISDWEGTKLQNAASMFYSSRIKNLDVNKLVTNSTTNISSMFAYSSISNLDTSHWDTSKVTNMSSVFFWNSGLTDLDLTHWNTSSVTNMSGLFMNARKLVSVNVSNWDTSKVTNMGSMFFMTSLSVVDISSFDTSRVTNMNQMFHEDSNWHPNYLNTVYVSDKFVTSNVPMNNYILNSASLIIGGAGTTISSGIQAHYYYYARIDDPDNGKPGYFTLKGARYIRYNNNGADGSETMTSHYLTNTGSLKTNVFTNTGKTFAGWNTEPDGSGTPYTDGQLMDDIVESKTPLTLYAQWE